MKLTDVKLEVGLTLRGDLARANQVTLITYEDDGSLWLSLPQEKPELSGAVETSPISHRKHEDTHLTLQSRQVLGEAEADAQFVPAVWLPVKHIASESFRHRLFDFLFCLLITQHKSPVLGGKSLLQITKCSSFLICAAGERQKSLKTKHF